MSGTESQGITLDAVIWGRATDGPDRMVSPPILCADGFRVSVQASWGHYCRDSAGERPEVDGTVTYPYVSVEVGYPSERPEPWRCTDWHQGFDSHADHRVCDGWGAYSNEGDDGDPGTVYGWVPVEMVRTLIASHGGEV